MPDNETVQVPTSENPYQPGKCWYGVKAEHLPGTPPAMRWCHNRESKRYRISRGSKTSIIYVWLCSYHATATRKAGYEVIESINQEKA